jgi:hypothetical protein
MEEAWTGLTVGRGGGAAAEEIGGWERLGRRHGWRSALGGAAHGWAANWRHGLGPEARLKMIAAASCDGGWVWAPRLSAALLGLVALSEEDGGDDDGLQLRRRR